MTMEQILIMVLIAIGSISVSIGGVMLIIAAFKESVGWGLSVWLFPPSGILFIVQNWAAARKAFYIQLFGYSVFVLGVIVGGSMGVRQMTKWFDDHERFMDPAGGIAALVNGMQVDKIGEMDAVPAAKAESRQTKNSPGGKYIGMPLEQVRAIHGDPKGIMHSEGRTIWLYDKLEIISSNGIHVVGESHRQP